VKKYDTYNIWSSESGIFHNVQNVLYKKQAFSKYEFVYECGTELLVGRGFPFEEDKKINKAELLYDAINLCENCDFSITDEYEEYKFSDDDKKRIIKFVNKYGFPLISVLNDYIGESPTYTSLQIFEELKELSIVVAAHRYLTKELTNFKSLTKKSFECNELIHEVSRDGHISSIETQRINNTWALISIIDYMYSASYKYLPEFFSDSLKGGFKYNLVAGSVFDIVRLQFCQMLNAGHIGICEICHKTYQKEHGNSKYCPNCKGWNGIKEAFTVRVSDKKYKENLKRDPIRLLCKQYMDRYRARLGANNNKYKSIKNVIIETREKAINDNWNIDELNIQLDSSIKMLFDPQL